MTPLEKVQAKIARLSRAIQREVHWQPVVAKKDGKDWLSCGHSVSGYKDRSRFCPTCSLIAYRRRNRRCSA